MTPQVQILTTIASRYSRDGMVSINPFFGASEDFVRSNIDEAKIVYDDVFKQFIGAWFVVGDKSVPPPLSWKVFEV